MYTKLTPSAPNDLFLPMDQRPGCGVYFARIDRYSPDAEALCLRFYKAAAQRGAVVETRLTNPDDRQLSYMTETLGAAFEPTESFVFRALEKWMPRLNPKHREVIANAVAMQFDEQRRAGKPDAVLRNIYMKLMCWLYYKFERLTPFLGENDPPKILYEGSEISAHELILLRIMSTLGVDILMVEAGGDTAYLKRDPQSQWSDLLKLGSAPFPADFSLKKLYREQDRPAPKPAAPVLPRPVVPPRQTVTPPRQPPIPPQRPAPTMQPRPAASAPTISIEQYIRKPAQTACTNAWMKEADMRQVLEPLAARGDDHQLFYNAYILYTGALDKLTYANELYQLHQGLLNASRNVLVIDGSLPQPQPEEIAKIRRRNYRTLAEMIVDLASNIPVSARSELQRQQQYAFAEVMQQEAKQETNLNRLAVSAVYLLCWVQRYQAQLFQGYKGTTNPCYIQLCGELSRHEQLFIRYLSRIPADVLILAPDLNLPAGLEDDALLTINGGESISGLKFPQTSGAVQLRTAASMAEQDLTQLLYTDSGMYRSHQFAQASALTLQTTYDELFILWDQEMKYRPNFSTEGGQVNMPVIFAQVNGVEGGKAKMTPYWQKVKQLCGSDTILYRGFPLQGALEQNSMMALSTKTLKNGVIRRSELKADRQYPFGLLRDELQEHIFDKVQLMLDKRYICGTFQNGTEYTILATVLNLKKDLLRMIQGFDFTRRSPKVVVVHTSDQSPTLEDTILLTFLSLVGFDVVLFVPTGYQTIARFLDDRLPTEHQIGDYAYDQRMPALSEIPSNKGPAWLNNLLKRGN